MTNEAVSRLWHVDDPSPEQVGDDGSPYLFRTFDLFFRNRPGWFGMEPIHDGPAREFFYDRSFAERDAIVNREFEILPMMVEFDAPAEVLNSVTLVTVRLPHFGSHPQGEFHVDIADANAADRIAELERQARQTSVVELFKDILFDR